MEYVVWVAPWHRDLTAGAEAVTLSGATVGELIDRFEGWYPERRNQMHLVR